VLICPLSILSNLKFFESKIQEGLIFKWGLWIFKRDKVQSDNTSLSRFLKFNSFVLELGPFLGLPKFFQHFSSVQLSLSALCVGREDGQTCGEKTGNLYMDTRI